MQQGTGGAEHGDTAHGVAGELQNFILLYEMVNGIVGYMKELRVPGATAHPDVKATASEDFAVIAEKVPSVFIYLSAGFENWRGEATAHNPKVQFNEDVLPVGAAYLAYCAVRWLEKHRQ